MNIPLEKTMKAKKRIVIVGATSLIAEHCARLWLEEGAADLILVGRDESKLQRTNDDLSLRAPESTVSWRTANFVDEVSIQATVSSICDDGLPDIVLIAHGALPDQEECQKDLRACRSALDINGVSPALFAEAFAARMIEADHGSIVVIGSVAGDRGRQSNYVYGAAKSMLGQYIEGLQHRLAAKCRKMSILLVKPGPTATPMTAHLSLNGASLAPVELVAQSIVRAAAAGRTEIYTPWKWRLIMMFIRHLPRFIFNKIRI